MFPSLEKQTCVLFKAHRPYIFPKRVGRGQDISDLHKVEQKRRAEREDSVGKWNDLLESSEAELYVTWSKYK